MKWSEQQENVFNTAASTSNSMIVEAVAGAGKTTTLVELVTRLRGHVAFLAFNKAIATEIGSRLNGKVDSTKVKSGTFHSFGFQAWRKVAPTVQMETKKLFLLCDELNIPKGYDEFARKAVSLAKQWGFGILSHIDNIEQWEKLVDRFELADSLEKEFETDDIDMETVTRDAIDWSILLLRKSIEVAHDMIDFDDMIYMPVLKGVKMWQYDWVLVDEAQDTNPLRLCMVKKILRPGGRMVAVGDPCQPIGTQVSTPKGVVSIETLRVGDRVISADIGSSAFIQSGKTITGITRKHFEGKLVRVSLANGMESRYTPAHRCVANFGALRKHYAIYLMRRGEQFRIGATKLSYSKSIGPASRMRAEDADALWLLETFTTSNEARVAEAVIAAKFGLPQLMFTAKNTSKIFTPSVLEKAWAAIGSNILQADMCLAHFGRDMRYPLFTTHDKPFLNSLKRPREVRACNLMSGVTMLPYLGKSHFRSSQWTPVVVTREQYTGDVLSLDVETYHNYVADGILTKNCQAIYGFSGADSDSLNKIAKEFNAVRVPLTTTYRCPKAVVAHARGWVSHIEAHETAPEGSVTSVKHEEFVKTFQTLRRDDAILCRNTAPLVSLAFNLIRNRVPCHVEGRDIGAGLIALAKRWKVRNVSMLRERLDAYLSKQREKFMAKGQEEKAAQLQDRVDTLNVIIDTLHPTDKVEALFQVINTLFGDTPEGQQPKSLTLSTVHRAKGREWERVYLLGRNMYMPSKYARQDWQVEQETNLIYVAITRAKSELIEIEV